MNLDPAPRPPKWIFFAIDAGLLLAAFIIVYFNRDNPYAPLPFVSAVVCVALAAIIGLIPFLIDYAADSAEYVQQERDRVTEQVQRLHTATESLARAAAQIKSVEEAVHKTAHSAETLPYRMQEKLAEFNAALAEKEGSEQEALEQELVELRAINSDQLKSVADKIQKAINEWTALETATRQQITLAQDTLKKIQAAANDTAARFDAKLNTALAALDAKLPALPRRSPEADHEAPPIKPERKSAVFASSASTPATTSAPTPAVASSVGAVSALSSATVPADDQPAPTVFIPEARVSSTPAHRAKAPAVTTASMPIEIKKTRSQPARKPADIVSNSPADDHLASEFVLTSEGSESAPSHSLIESSTSSDGSTRLLVTAYIGIGNKLFIRGDGPGLSWNAGVPMQFVSIGKWGWATPEATQPIRCVLYKNDEQSALSGEVVVEPGKHVEVTALF